MDCNNYLIQGALSCGKTYEAKRLACCAVGLLNKDDKLDENLFKENVGSEKQIEYVPVHEEYEYSSFVQGIEVESVNGRMVYRPIDRVFVDICERAANDSGNNYAMILDDIDKVNIMAVFGELLYAIENRDEEITLQSGTKLTVPENLTIIATITSVMQNNKPDYAFLRRFKQIELFSDISVIENLIVDGLCVSEAKDEYEKYNNFIIKYLADDLKEYERYYLLGHGWFIADSEFAMSRKIYHQIIPLIERYHLEGILDASKDDIKVLGEQAKQLCVSVLPVQTNISKIENNLVIAKNVSGVISNLNAYISKPGYGVVPNIVECFVDLIFFARLLPVETLLTDIFLEPRFVKIWSQGNSRIGTLFCDSSFADNYTYTTSTKRQNGKPTQLYRDKTSYQFKNKNYYLLVLRAEKDKQNLLKRKNQFTMEANAPGKKSKDQLVSAVGIIYNLILRYYELLIKKLSSVVQIYSNNQNYISLLELARIDYSKLNELESSKHSILDLRNAFNALNILWHECGDTVTYTDNNGNVKTFILEGVHNMDTKDYRDIMDTLNIRQMILQGPPGTSKTYGAKEFLCKEAEIPDVDGKIDEGALKNLQIKAEEYEKAEKGTLTVDQDRKLYWDIVQFHPSYGYEDFVRGITVTPVDTASEILTGEINQEAGGKSIVSISAPKTGIRYETVNKTLGKIAKLAECVGDKPVYLIIDEINRANVSTVFGELIYALEYRDENVATPYKVGNESNIKLPENLYIIGTMNTADKSIGNIDYAVRRRFLFFPMLPNIKVVEKHVNGKSYSEKVINLFNTVAGLFDTNLNEDFNKDDVQVGHTMFLVDSEEEMKLRFEYQILPILREYYKDGVLIDNGNGDEKSKKIMEYLEKFGKSTPMEISELNAVLFDEDRVTNDE